MASTGWFREWAAAALVAFFVAVSAAAQFFYNEVTSPASKVLLGTLTAGCLIGAAVTPIVDQKRRQRRRLSHRDALEDAVRDARTDSILALNDALDPLIEDLAKTMLSARHERSELAGKAITQALNSASSVVGQGRTRVNFFEVRGEASSRRLVCDRNSAGRAGAPTTEFVEGTAAGDFMFGLLERDKPHFCSDTIKKPPPGWDPDRPRDYRTFISVPARVGEQSVGFVTADSPDPGDLREHDTPFLRVVGTVIAAGVLTSW